VNLERLIAVARADAKGDLLLRNARIVNVFTSEVEPGDVVIAEGRIAGIGPGCSARQVIDLEGSYLLPSFINGHIHPESSHLYVHQYARALVPRGTTAIVTDLHELANVGGLPALRCYLQDADSLPLDIFLMVPSCVPATFHLETSGAALDAGAIAEALSWPHALGLGEVMDFPAVIAGHGPCLDKVRAAAQRTDMLPSGRVIDGHAPRVSGRALNAYLAAGPCSDHESTALEEGREKLRRGMHLMIREGTTEKNLAELLPLVSNDTYPRCLLVVDDRSPADLRDDGDMDAVVRKAIRLGLDPLRAVQLATINPATHFGLRDRGAVGPGYLADLIVADDLTDLRPRLVIYRGHPVAEAGRALFPTPFSAATQLASTFRIGPLPEGSLTPLAPARGHVPVIEIVPGQIITRRLDLAPRVENGLIVSDPERDILKLAVVERHHATGNVGVGLVRGFGLKRGAIASSFAHDSHNIVVVGASDADMLAAVRHLAAMQGGLTAILDGQPLASLPLPIAGLMSPEPVEVVAARHQAVETAAATLGVSIRAPFAVLSFLALPVIPDLKVTDKGLVDVAASALIDLSSPAT
jgi:adenine deaminase